MLKSFRVQIYGINLSKHYRMIFITSNYNIIILSYDRYYFSTFEDDSLLCLLDDSAYSKDEQRIKVIPEDMKIKIDEAVLDNLKELKEWNLNIYF